MRSLAVYISILCLFVNARLAMSQNANLSDPSLRGPNEVQIRRYDLGDQVFRPDRFPISVELKAVTFAPRNGQNNPLVLILHGRHRTCFNPENNEDFLEWPCTNNREEIPSYRGYDYLASHLASRGFFVVSISSNGINAVDDSVEDFGADARARLIQQHLQLLQASSDEGAGTFEDAFLGEIDFTRVSTIGHSRGGEGVLIHSLLSSFLEEFTPVTSVLTLASTNFNQISTNLVPFGSIIPYCDGDVAGLGSVRIYDSSTALSDQEPNLNALYQLLLLGGNHNYFNTVWTPGLFTAGTFDDWEFVDEEQVDQHCGLNNSSNERISSPNQRLATIIYSTAFLELNVNSSEAVRGDSTIDPNIAVLSGSESSPLTNLLGSEQARYSFRLPPDQRLDVSQFSDSNDVLTNDLGLPVEINGISTRVCGGGLNAPACLEQSSNFQSPHDSVAGTSPSIVRLGLQWLGETASFYSTQLPIINLNDFDLLQFRIAIDIEETPNQRPASGLLVELTDINGNQQAVALNNPEVLSFPPGFAETSSDVLPRSLLNFAQVSLNRFNTIDLSNVNALRFLFEEGSEGSIFISEISFVSLTK